VEFQRHPTGRYAGTGTAIFPVLIAPLTGYQQCGLNGSGALASLRRTIAHSQSGILEQEPSPHPPSPLATTPPPRAPASDRPYMSRTVSRAHRLEQVLPSAKSSGGREPRASIVPLL